MPPLLLVEDLHYAYPPPRPQDPPSWVLRGVDLRLEEGECLALLGPTGAGKTTLCLALNGLVPRSTGGLIRGRVLVEGLDTRRHPVPELARRVGLVFQDPETQFFHLTVEAEVAFGPENLGLPRAEIAERVDWALRLVGMQAHRHRSPFHLSGGEKQRVAIASILAMTPKVLVLDEPTAYLDPRGKAEVLAVVRRLRQERTMAVVLVEQDLEQVAEFADRVAVLDAGRVVLEGPAGVVLAQAERLRALGLTPPAVADLADCLNRRLGTRFAFTRVEQARETLERRLNG